MQFIGNKGFTAIGIFVDYKKNQNTAEKIFWDFTFLKVAKKASATPLSQGRPEFEKGLPDTTFLKQLYKSLRGIL